VFANPGCGFCDADLPVFSAWDAGDQSEIGEQCVNLDAAQVNESRHLFSAVLEAIQNILPRSRRQLFGERDADGPSSRQHALTHDQRGGRPDRVDDRIDLRRRARPVCLVAGPAIQAVKIRPGQNDRIRWSFGVFRTAPAMDAAKWGAGAQLPAEPIADC
jgi:hypothetical protein